MARKSGQLAAKKHDSSTQRRKSSKPPKATELRELVIRLASDGRNSTSITSRRITELLPTGSGVMLCDEFRYTTGCSAGTYCFGADQASDRCGFW